LPQRSVFFTEPQEFALGSFGCREIHGGPKSRCPAIRPLSGVAALRVPGRLWPAIRDRVRSGRACRQGQSSFLSRRSAVCSGVRGDVVLPKSGCRGEGFSHAYGMGCALRHVTPERELHRRVAQAFDLAGINHTGGAASFAFFAKGGSGNVRTTGRMHVVFAIIVGSNC